MKILLPVDGSVYSRSAIDFVATRASLLGKHPDIELLNVQTPPTFLQKLFSRETLDEHTAKEAENTFIPIRKIFKSEGMTESDMLAEVWAQEDQVRQETEDWLWPYLALAYQPLSDEEMQAYQVFSEAPEGRALNAALFAAFDASFVRISGELGRAVALMVQGQDI